MFSYEVYEVLYPFFTITTRCLQLLDHFVEIFSRIAIGQSAFTESVSKLSAIVSSSLKIIEHLDDLRRDGWNWSACNLNIDWYMNTCACQLTFLSTATKLWCVISCICSSSSCVCLTSSAMGRMILSPFDVLTPRCIPIDSRVFGSNQSWVRILVVFVFLRSYYYLYTAMDICFQNSGTRKQWKFACRSAWDIRHKSYSKKAWEFRRYAHIQSHNRKTHFVDLDIIVISYAFVNIVRILERHSKDLF